MYSPIIAPYQGSPQYIRAEGQPESPLYTIARRAEKLREEIRMNVSLFKSYSDEYKILRTFASDQVRRASCRDLLAKVEILSEARVEQKKEKKQLHMELKTWVKQNGQAQGEDIAIYSAIRENIEESDDLDSVDTNEVSWFCYFQFCCPHWSLICRERPHWSCTCGERKIEWLKSGLKKGTSFIN